MRRVLEDPRFAKVNQNIKHDRHVLWRAYGVDVVGVAHDTLVASKLRDSDGPGALDWTAWQVGWGGYKGVGQEGADDE